MEQTRNCGNNGFDMYNIGDRCEYVQYAIEIERTLHNMQKELNTCIDPRKAAMLIMRVATEFYDADWCGILDVDMEIGVWTPIWWYDTEFGEMAQTKFEEFELSEKYGRWIQCLRDHEPIIVPDVEAIKEEMPDEYMLYRRLDANAVMAVPFWKGPTGFLTLRNAKKYKNQTGFLRMLNYAVISSLNEYFLLETRKLTIISPRITNATDVYISLFGELKITTEKGVLTEQELKSPKIARLLVYLLLKGKMTASPREIASAIWPGEDIEATVKNIKGLVYRFRQTFELLSDHRLIESTPTGYQINPRLNVFTDFQLFDKKWSIAMKAADHKEKVEFLKKAIDLYQGPLFGSARDEHWIMSKVVAFEYRYLGAVCELMKTLDLGRDYVCIQHYACLPQGSFSMHRFERSIPLMMNRNNENRTVAIARQVIAAIAALFLLSLFLSVRGAAAEDSSAFDMDNWNGESVILEDPQYFMGVEDDDIPVISSVGKKNVKIHGVQSKYKLVNYTIPEQLLRADPDFLALMVEAEKYIGFPYVYGASNPDTGFDCSGYVCWVFNNSGVCDVGRMGANGLYSLCSDVSKEDARPGDLVFFEKTMGADVKGITHVGIYVGNDMMIHAGDPVGFADLKSEKWSKRLYGFGRLPLD